MDDIGDIEVMEVPISLWDRAGNYSTQVGSTVTKTRDTVRNHLNRFLGKSDKEQIEDLPKEQLNMELLGKFAWYLAEEKTITCVNSATSYVSEAKEIMVLLGASFDPSIYKNLRKWTTKVYTGQATLNNTVLMYSAEPISEEHSQFIGEILFLNLGKKCPERMHLFRALIMLNRQLVGRI